MGKAQQASTPSERSHRPARATTCFVMITPWMLPLLRAVIRRRPFNTRLAAKAWQPGTHAKNPGTRAKKQGRRPRYRSRRHDFLASPGGLKPAAEVLLDDADA